MAVVGRRTVVFHHVPKTAGTTMRILMRSRYAPQKTFALTDSHKYELIESFSRMSQRERDEYQLVLGHQANKLANMLTSPFVLTFLRDPVSRVVSLYYFARELRLTHPYHEITNRLSLNRLFQEGIQHEWTELSDGQYRSLMSWDVFAALHQAYGLDETLDRLVMGESPQLFVGLMERFDESLILLQRRLGWSKYPYYQKKNINKPKRSSPALSDETRALVIANNKKDIELYEAASRVYQRYLEKEGIGLVKRDVELFHKKNRLFGRLEGMRHFISRALVKIGVGR